MGRGLPNHLLFQMQIIEPVLHCVWGKEQKGLSDYQMT